MNESTGRARRLRHEMTRAEVVLWQRLRAKQLGGLKFRRQYPLSPFIADFFCPSARLVIEIDGLSHDSDHRHRRDQARDEWMRQQGLEILRFQDEDVLQNIEGVCGRILQVCYERSDAPSPGPSREGRGE